MSGKKGQVSGWAAWDAEQRARRLVERQGNSAEYPDDGCEFSPSCLTCPLPYCRYEMPSKVAGMIPRVEQARALLNQGMNEDEAGRRMGVSTRTIFRLKKVDIGAIPTPPGIVVLEQRQAARRAGQYEPVKWAK